MHPQPLECVASLRHWPCAALRSALPAAASATQPNSLHPDYCSMRRFTSCLLLHTCCTIHHSRLSCMPPAFQHQPVVAPCMQHTHTRTPMLSSCAACRQLPLFVLPLHHKACYALSPLKKPVVLRTPHPSLPAAGVCPAAMTSGCVPNTVRPNGNATKCIYNWWDDTMGHGTHTSGTIGAMRNGKGIIGVSAEGAQIYQ